MNGILVMAYIVEYFMTLHNLVWGIDEYGRLGLYKIAEED